MFRDAIVNLSLNRNGDDTIRYAVSVAKYFNLHLTPVAIEYEFIATGSPFETAAFCVVSNQIEQSRELANAAARNFEHIARQESILSNVAIIRSDLTGACNWFAKQARHHDLAIVTQPDPPAPETLLIEAALFESGRPVLVVPRAQKTPFTHGRIGICWNGSCNAARAVSDSMPFLKRGTTIEFISVADGDAKSDNFDTLGMKNHLARHDIQAVTVSLPKSKKTIAETIIAYSTDNQIDLLVLGGYGHSRLREYVLGGVTHDVLDWTTVPILMSH